MTEQQTDQLAQQNDEERKFVWTCPRCDREIRTKTDKRLPKGWKRNAGVLWCAACWKACYCIRAMRFQVASPVEGWKPFRAAVKLMWQSATRAANWISTELYVRDVKRDSSMERLPPRPKTYLYPELKELFPEFPKMALSGMEQRCTGNYNANRYNVIWKQDQSLRNYKYPVPFAVQSQGWTAYYENDYPMVAVRLADTRFHLRLKGGSRYRRSLAAFRRLVNGELIPSELSIYRKKAKGDEGKLTGRDSGGQQATYYTMLKLVMWFPKGPRPEGEQTLFVHSAEDSLLVALNVEDERLWHWHADHVPRWATEHRKQLQRWSDDQKAEQRPVADFQSRRERATTRYHRRMTKEIERAARQLINYAARRRFSKIRYDDTVRDYVPEFPWYELKHRVATLCHEKRMEFIDVSAPEEEPVER